MKKHIEQIQKSVLQYASVGRPYEVMAAILKARNRNTTIREKDMRSDEGGKSQLQIEFYQVTGLNTVTEPKRVYFELSKKTKSAVYQLNRDDIRYIDGDFKLSDHAKAAINAALPAVRRKLAVEVAAYVSAHENAHPKEVEGFDRLNNDLSGLASIDTTDKIVVGGVDCHYWRNKTQDADIYYDSLICDCYSDESEHLLVLDPMMFKFLSYNRNSEIFATDLQNVDAINKIERLEYDELKMTIADAVNGLLMDLNITYDKNNYRWTFQWGIEWDIFFMPSVMSDTGVTHYKLFNSPITNTNDRR